MALKRTSLPSGGEKVESITARQITSRAELEFFQRPLQNTCILSSDEVEIYPTAPLAHQSSLVFRVAPFERHYIDLFRSYWKFKIKKPGSEGEEAAVKLVGYERATTADTLSKEAAESGKEYEEYMKRRRTEEGTTGKDGDATQNVAGEGQGKSAEVAEGEDRPASDEPYYSARNLRRMRIGSKINVAPVSSFMASMFRSCRFMLRGVQIGSSHSYFGYVAYVTELLGYNRQQKEAHLKQQVRTVIVRCVR